MKCYKVVVARRIATGTSAKDAQFEVAQYVEAGNKIYLKAAAGGGKVDVDPEVFEKSTERCLSVYGI
jgi:hypothetical protein